jgi:glycosyltransferase involved in cell wall biosynthesis
MRVGHNPNTNKMTNGTPDHMMSVITHLPNLDKDGYHEKRLDVVKACLLSMRNGAPTIPVTIFDNGSCDALIDWLRNVYEPHTLILSPNIGKSNARAALFRMFRPDTVMTVSDDDMLFYPGWYEASYKLLQGFPDVGKVSCYPVRTQGRWGCDFTKEWAKDNGNLEEGRFISDEEEYDFCTSVGRDYKWHFGEYTIEDKDYRVTYNDLQAYCFGHHCQFMAYVGRIIPFCVRVDSCMHDEKPFEIAIDQAHLLQLTTIQRYARHIGNVIDEKVAKELREMQIMEEVLC